MAQSKKTIAENAVKSALEAAQAFADIENDSAGEAAALTKADKALADAEAAVVAAGLDDRFAATLETIRAMIAPEDAAPPAPDPDPTPPAPDPDPVADYHTIAQGKSITTKRGILGEGVRINPDDLPGGAKALKGFVKSGHVLKPVG